MTAVSGQPFHVAAQDALRLQAGLSRTPEYEYCPATPSDRPLDVQEALAPANKLLRSGHSTKATLLSSLLNEDSLAHLTVLSLARALLLQ